MKVVIVGAGLAGLACATEMAEAGHQVEILEKREVWGGKVSSWQDHEGDSIESGVHIFFRTYKQLLPFLKRVGVYDNIKWKEHSILLAQPGGHATRLHFPNLPAPFNGMIAFTNTDLFSWREKLTNIKGLFGLYIHNLDYIKKLDKYSYADWHRQQGMQQGVLDKLWNVIALSLGFIGAEEVSARPMATVFHYFARDGKASLLGFLDTSPAAGIFDPIRRYLENKGVTVRNQAKVQELLLNAAGTVAGLKMADGEVITADVYVLAAPIHNTRQMLPDSLRHHVFFDNLWKLKSVPVMNVQLWYDREISSTDNLFFTAHACFSVFADLHIVSPKAYGQHPGSVMGLVVAPAAPLWQLSDQEIIARCHQELAVLWPSAAQATVLKGTVVRIPNSIYRETPDSDAFRPTQKTPVANLFLAGDYTQQDYMASMEGAVRSGLAAAREILGANFPALANSAPTTVRGKAAHNS